MIFNGGFLPWISRENAELFSYNTDKNLDILLMLLWNDNEKYG